MATTHAVRSQSAAAWSPEAISQYHPAVAALSNVIGSDDVPARSLSLIFAMAENGVIGKDGGLPWSYPEDREHFLGTTRHHAVIMGRRTWDEKGAPLPDRTNIVVTRSDDVTARWPSVRTARSLDEALRIAWEVDSDPFVIGGVRLLEEATPIATRVYLTEIKGRPAGDAILRFDRSGFRVESERVSPPDLRFLVLVRPIDGGAATG